MTHVKQKIRIRGETYYYQTIYSTPILAHFGTKGKYPLEGNPDYTGIKVEFIKGDQRPLPARTFGMWLRREHPAPEYECIEYATAGHRPRRERE